MNAPYVLGLLNSRVGELFSHTTNYKRKMENLSIK